MTRAIFAAFGFWAILQCCIILISTLDHARGASFRPVVFPPCQVSACDADISGVTEKFEETLELRGRAFFGFSPFSETNYCTASISILEDTGATKDQLRIPASLERRGILSIVETNGITTVAPGPVLSSWKSLAWENLFGRGLYSCHMSYYSTAFKMANIFLLIFALVIYHFKYKKI